MAHEYYILEEGVQQGPYTFHELTAMDLDIHTRVLSPQAENWEDACDLPELYPYFESRGIYLPTGDNLASFGWRFLAWVIDYFLISLLASFIVNALIANGVVHAMSSYATLLKASPRELFIVQLSFIIPLIIYNTVCEASPMKGSIGKKLCRLVVVDIDGMGLTFVNALLRSFGKSISVFLLYIGFITIFFTEHKQALHDQLAKTYVVKL